MNRREFLLGAAAVGFTGCRTGAEFWGREYEKGWGYRG